MKEISHIYQHFLNSKGVVTDTRKDVSGKMFFALSGENFDGNKFASQALKSGASVCVIDNPDYKINDKFIVVPDVLSALQKMAHHHRIVSNAKVLAITGSNGKTTTKELISSVLGSSTNITSTSGNLNNHIGVPLTLLKIKKNTKIAVVEMGANHIGEINSLCEIADPDIGIITNIGKAHLEGFGSFLGVITAKSELYKFIKKKNGKVIVNVSDPLLNDLSKEIPRMTYGTNNADVEGDIICSYPFLTLKWRCNNNISQCNSRLYGKYNFNNILCAIATGIYFDVDIPSINQSIEQYISKNNRSQLIKTKSNRIVLDAYNANPYSMNEAIQSFLERNFKNTWLFIGDMFELGVYSAEEHNIIIDILKSSGFDNVVLIGNEFKKLNNRDYITFETTNEAIEFLKVNKINGSDILIKGSRGMKLEKLVEYL